MQTPLSRTARNRLVRRAAIASTIVAIVLILSKSWAYFETSSASVLGSLLDSLLDSGASILNLFAVIHAAKPADTEHRFGHGKAEALAGLGQAVFIAGAAILLAWQAVLKFIQPMPIEKAELGIGVIAFSIVATLGLIAYQKSVIKQTSSTAISADSLHYTGDLLMNTAVIGALSLAGYFEGIPIDALAGLGIAAFILWQAGRIAWQAGNELMDAELPDAEREHIQKLACEDKRVLDIHDFRTRRSGQHVFIEMHAEMNRTLSLLEAHTIADGIMIRIQKEYPHAEVIVHEDPEGIDEHRQHIQR